VKSYKSCDDIFSSSRANDSPSFLFLAQTFIFASLALLLHAMGLVWNRLVFCKRFFRGAIKVMSCGIRILGVLRAIC
jgi:hypothetical protein